MDGTAGGAAGVGSGCGEGGEGVRGWASDSGVRCGVYCEMAEPRVESSAAPHSAIIADCPPLPMARRVRIRLSANVPGRPSSSSRAAALACGRQARKRQRAARAQARSGRAARRGQERERRHRVGRAALAAQRGEARRRGSRRHRRALERHRRTGASLLRYSIGPISGAAGYDGKTVWTQDGTDPPKVETAPAALELAANAAYRDRLAFWYPDRARARIEYKERAEADGRKYDVVVITPEGGRTVRVLARRRDASSSSAWSSARPRRRAPRSIPTGARCRACASRSTCARAAATPSSTKWSRCRSSRTTSR